MHLITVFLQVILCLFSIKGILLLFPHLLFTFIVKQPTSTYVISPTNIFFNLNNNIFERNGCSGICASTILAHIS